MSIASSKPVVNAEDGDRRMLQVRATQSGEVDMDTAIPPLAAYLHNHSQWIERCFKPLTVTPLSETTYQLKFFRMGGLGFELEPQFGVEIGSNDEQHFFLKSLELPGDDELPYTVSCRSEFNLEDSGSDGGEQTTVHWTLHLNILVKLPKFLLVLPRKRVQQAAEQVVNQVAKRMCQRLTHNVCDDYYRSVGKDPKRLRK